MDLIAHEVGIEPYEVRLRNLVPAELMGDFEKTGKRFDSGNHADCLMRAVGLAKIDDVRVRQRSPEADGRLIGVGLSFYVEQGAMGTSVMAAWGRPIVPGYEQANIKVTVDGDIEIRVGMHSSRPGARDGIRTDRARSAGRRV